MIDFKKGVLCSVVTCLFIGCANTDLPRASATEVSEVALSDVPQTVNAVVSQARPEFTTTEVLKKVRDGRVYYDVEGELPNGDEIEFDVLMTDNGPEIVEIQRDLDWAAVPQKAQTVANEANSKGLAIVRVIESQQTDGAIIYELFVDGHPSDPRFEVRMKDGEAKLLTSRWEH